MADSIVMYFSHTGENYFGGTIKRIEKGNTAVVAEMLAEMTESDLFEIVPQTPYPDNYKQCVRVAAAEYKDNSRPPVKTVPDIGQYRTIYLGYPNWCGTYPMCVATALESMELKGKTIRPFCTNEGSGMGTSERDLRELVPGVAIGSSLSIIGSHVDSCKPALEEWLARD